jgi:phenylpyruvate tautomerase PptA (4-oxalocrotonate tautomerase family)
MPIFHVDMQGTSDPPPGLAKGLADELGALLGSEPGHTWVRITRCDPSHYAENAIDVAPDWVFVRVILRRLPDEDALAERALAIASLVARHTGRSREHVHLLFELPPAGRIAFGGELVRSR